MEVSTPARIAVYDDAAAAPRVVMVEPKDVRSFLEEITATVNRLSHEQGGTIPFMVIREIVENFIHAYFKAPTITILDGGNTIRFSDQGPGIKQKDLALEYGTSSATEEMKHYIRGVGSGLPYAQQYMVDKGGSLDIEDNLGGGTVVTISTHPREEPPAPQAPMAGAYARPYQQQWSQQPQPFGQAYGQQWPTQPWQQTAPMGQPAAQQPYAPMAGMPAAAPQLNERSQAILGFLSAHELCGPTDLANALGGSNATWSRALQDLASQGVVIKDSQKYRLTGYGQSLLG